MRFSGRVQPDGPDPEIERRAEIAALGFPIVGFAAQRHLEEAGAPSVARSTESRAPEWVERVAEVSVTCSYTLWRNPDDRDDPVNLAPLDDRRRAALDRPPATPLPDWFPALREAVKTVWAPEVSARLPLHQNLIAHVEHVLTDTFRDELGLGDREWCAPIPAAAVQPCAVTPDGRRHDGVLVDTDPFVLGLAAQLASNRLFCAAVPREHLPFVQLAFASTAPSTPASA